MTKYNLAFIPTTEQQAFIDIASKFSNMSASYCLGKNSLPHVTIRHFHCTEQDLEAYWKEFKEQLQHHSLQLVFKEFSCLSFDNKVHYTSLLPDNVEQLIDMHKAASRILNLDIKPKYDPHLTLFNTKDLSYIGKIEEYRKIYTPIQDVFQLSIGLSDGVGQYLKVIKTI